MNEDLKKKLEDAIEENFGYMDDRCHKILDEITKDEPNWTSE